MTVFRYGNIGVWWKQQIKEVYLLHSWYYILMFVVLKLRIQKYWTANLYLEILMILIHSLFMLTIMILVRIVVNNMLASFTCILMLEILSIYAFSTKMVLRSKILSICLGDVQYNVIRHIQIKGMI